MVRFLYDSVDAAITKPQGAHGFYLPTYEQTPLAKRELEYFAGHGIAVTAGDCW